MKGLMSRLVDGRKKTSLPKQSQQAGGDTAVRHRTKRQPGPQKYSRPTLEMEMNGLHGQS